MQLPHSRRSKNARSDRHRSGRRCRKNFGGDRAPSLEGHRPSSSRTRTSTTSSDCAACMKSLALPSTSTATISICTACSTCRPIGWAGKLRRHRPSINCVREGDIIRWGGYEAQIIHTPGHTPGSICLFMPSDLPNGNHKRCETKQVAAPANCSQVTHFSREALAAPICGEEISPELSVR